ncbi:hypothetical protein EIK77_007098 [Talaromyces pinophilus]|nr:hypothetical protein EIK77_007098 [Talaromyces pinophilus]
MHPAHVRLLLSHRSLDVVGRLGRKNGIPALETGFLGTATFKNGLDLLQVPATGLDEEEIDDNCAGSIDQDVEDIETPGDVVDGDWRDVSVDNEDNVADQRSSINIYPAECEDDEEDVQKGNSDTTDNRIPGVPGSASSDDGKRDTHQDTPNHEHSAAAEAVDQTQACKRCHHHDGRLHGVE